MLVLFDVQDSRDLYSECLRTFWACPNCDLYMPLTPLERMQHETSCRPAGEQQQEAGLDLYLPTCICISFVNFTIFKCFVVSEPESGQKSSLGMSSLTRVYHCDICNKDLTLTSTEILKHKRQHMYSANN